MCGFCDIENKKDLDLFTDAEIEAIILAVYGRIITVNNLDTGSYLKVARKLLEGVFKGYGKTFEGLDYDSVDYLMLHALKENVFVFSAAKQYQQVREMTKGLTKGKSIVPFGEFKKTAKVIFDEYNQNYLKAEYNSAIAQSRSASAWQEITKQAKQFPMLTYHTVGDMRVRPTHASLDHITRPVNDKFWNIYYPPNGWNCRCTVLQNDDLTETDLKGFKHPDDVPDIFMFNSGKDKIVFSPKHPYFSVAPKDKQNAKNNWGLPIP